jgi:hypothetical protein
MTLHQYEIPGEPQSAVIRHYSLKVVAELKADFRAAISSKPPSAVGVSIELAQAGPRIESLALATQDTVFCLSLRTSPSPMQRKVLQELFSTIQYLAGFEFPHTIVLLAHTLGSTITGYDLSTLALLSKHSNITTPGNFLNSKNSKVSARRINERWDGDVLRNRANSAGTPEPDYALRAWFTAMCVIWLSSCLLLQSFSTSSAANLALKDLSQGQKLSTEFINVTVRSHWVLLMLGMLTHHLVPCRCSSLSLIWHPELHV